MSAVPVDATVPVPLRECTPWCESNRTGHAEEHPDDRSCWTGFHQLHLSQRRPVKMGGGEWVSDWLDLCLRRRPDAEHGVLLLNDETNRWELELTRDEVKQLIASITTLFALDEQ